MDEDELKSHIKEESHQSRYHGHTIRRKTTSRGFFTTGYIHKSIDAAYVPAWLEEYFPDDLTEGLVYSINKKKRWKLVEYLISGISQFDRHSEDWNNYTDDMRVCVTICERTKLCFNNAAVIIHCTQEPKHHQIDKTRCFNASSFKQKSQPADDKRDSCNIQYDVVYPPDFDWFQRRVNYRCYKWWKDANGVKRQWGIFSRDDGDEYSDGEFDEEVEDEEVAIQSRRSGRYVVSIEDLILVGQAKIKASRARAASKATRGRRGRAASQSKNDRKRPQSRNCSTQ